MTAIAEFTLPPEAFPIGRVFESHPTARLTLDRVVPTHDTMLPFFWVHAPEGTLSEILTAIDRVDQLCSVELLEEFDHRGLFQIEWDPTHLGLLEVLARTEVTVLSASGSKHGWLFELRAADRSAFTSFQQHCQRREIPVSLASLSRLSEWSVGTVHCLTTEQREALELAYQQGYYDTPRETTLAELAQQLGISRQALSARLRRGYCALIERGVLTHDRENS